MTAGSASGPCIVHGDPWHAKCLTHECCIGHQGTECRIIPARAASACQCDISPGHPCERPLTQEDLLCNPCRLVRKDLADHDFLDLPGVARLHFALFKPDYIREILGLNRR